ncbi:MAG: DUF2608 domain-containing protein [Parachlamydiaceae bacterium]|nr:DUF2608 domain-containing protein [Parachlamydiaceae bacterium]
MKLLLFILTFFVCSQSFAIITQVNDLELIEQTTQQLTPQDLVLFDIDWTIIIAEDPLLRPCGAHLLAKLKKEILDKDGQVDLHLSRIWNESKYTLVDPKILTLIHNLQKRNIPTMGLTGIRTGKMGVIPNLEDWRLEQLQQQNIDFSHSYPTITFPEFPAPPPIFKHGVLFTSWNSKGTVLVGLLKKLDFTPCKVIFVDDHLEYIETVEAAMHDLGIEFHGFHYKGALPP